MKKIMITLIVLLGLLTNVYAAHEHHAPHKGLLIVLGEEFAHLELVFDSSTGSLTAYSLDGEAENAISLSVTEIDFQITPPGGQMFNLSLKAVENPLTGETIDQTSQFGAQTDLLKGLTEFHVVITEITTKGQTFKNIAFDYPEGNDHDEDKTK